MTTEQLLIILWQIVKEKLVIQWKYITVKYLAMHVIDWDVNNLYYKVFLSLFSFHMLFAWNYSLVMRRQSYVYDCYDAILALLNAQNVGSINPAQYNFLTVSILLSIMTIPCSILQYHMVPSFTGCFLCMGILLILPMYALTSNS